MNEIKKTKIDFREEVEIKDPYSPDKNIKQKFRKEITQIEKSMIGAGCIQGDNAFCPLKHSFAEGVYVREIFIPKGARIIGKIHKHSHPNFLMSGEVIVATEEGPKHLKAPMSMISPAGTKRAVYAIENTVWVTVHLTDSKDLKVIEEEVIAKDYEAYEKFIAIKNNREILARGLTLSAPLLREVV